MMKSQKEVEIMKSSEGQSKSPEINDTEMEPTAGQRSPTEKLEGDLPPGSIVPGAENPESKEIKKEVNPNTE